MRRTLSFLANTIFVLLACSLIWESNVTKILNLNFEAWRNQPPPGNDTRDIEVKAVSEFIELHDFSFVSPDILYLHWKHGQALPYVISHPGLAFSSNQEKSMVFMGMSLGSSESNILSIFKEMPELIVVRSKFPRKTSGLRTLWKTNIQTCYNQLNSVLGTKLIELSAYRRKDDC